MSICDVYILVAAQHDIPHALGQLSIVGRRRPLPLPGRRSGIKPIHSFVLLLEFQQFHQLQSDCSISMGLITPTQLYQRHLLGEIFNPFAGLFSQLLVSGMTLWLLKEHNRGCVGFNLISHVSSFLPTSRRRSVCFCVRRV